ncbi:DUF1538 domain-containing protein [Tissierella creatinophila]|uniref:DUF1538 domain-containing protein n=1 Tax=Tissierella creatinophila DSM 6911 TaxID=1123403 RepID=A0A1U7M8Y1_TISCR|nr:DUF1538 domain-containing protein [Tissierella creatinophila]OLS03700.1 hypothetical protein TICRE_02130 [Tissierella creatinophila DSM 6911]
MKFIEILSPLWETVKGILPLTIIMVVFQVFILKKPIENVAEFTIGVILAILGLHLFLKGTTMSLIPLGDSVGRNLYLLDKKIFIVLIGFVIGYFGTLVEPALRTLALEVEEVSAGAISQRVLIHGVAAGFGLGMGIGLFKIINNISYIKIIVPLLAIVLILIFISPKMYVSIAMDSASATTGPVNIPINMALAIGIASVIEGVDPLLSGFGIVGLTSVGAMISVLVLGILSNL